MTTVDVRDLLNRPGSSRELHVSPVLEDLGTELAAVPAETPVRVTGLLESVVEGILVSGAVSGPVAFRCARCLTEFTRDVRVDVAELFGLDVEDPAEDTGYIVRDGELDLEPLIRDSLVLALPFSPLCRPDCLGLCERCGGNRNLGECSCEPEVDERWSALADLDLD
ncbi:MAG TPA: YceD family protein [Actinomycetota bacterium]|nr:YceD family protein [Actinomycetota bacterium]